MSARRVPTGARIVQTIQFGLSMGVVLASLWGLLGGCREQSTVPIDRNLAPETFLTSAPGDSQTAFYRVALHWAGVDRDGTVSQFDVAVTDSLPGEEILWRRTARSDSLVVFRVEETREVLGHRFYVRAVDNEGRVDPTPAWIFFGSRNNVAPEVDWLRAIAYEPISGATKGLTSENQNSPTDTIPTGWGVRFAWDGSDGDVAVAPDGRIIQVGRVDRYFHRMLPVESGYLPPGGSLADTAAEYPPDFFLRIPKGNVYVMQVKAMDDGGLTGSGAITRSFVWNRDPITRIQRCASPGSDYERTCFTSRGQTFFSGDTLPLGRLNDDLPSLSTTATAFDPDPIDGDSSVASMEWRSGSGAVFSSWLEYEGGGAPIELSGLRTGDYIMMVRAVDRLDRLEGTPDSLRFSVNLKPVFVLERDGFSQTPRNGDVFRLSDLAQGLACRFLVENPDGDPAEKIGYGIRFETPLEREASNSFEQVLNPDVAYDITNAKPRGGQREFIVGDYKLFVEAKDNAQAGGDTRGGRANRREVRFRVIPD
ncbi:MAG: hypothetical protein FJY88_01515 [Candidatus Eisenbacteria bacterium]|nr:hypothetical protein [Candidatus Eisenbacteria bacterium]